MRKIDIDKNKKEFEELLLSINRDGIKELYLLLDTRWNTRSSLYWLWKSNKTYDYGKSIATAICELLWKCESFYKWSCVKVDKRENSNKLYMK